LRWKNAQGAVRKAIFSVILAAGFGLCLGSAATAQQPELVVETTSGKVRGISRPAGGAEFLGIPYAAAPVGELRWREPAAVPPWGEVKDASSFGAPCAQPELGEWNKRNAESGKEDCLFLNVMTSEWPAKTPRAVMFWIHGGANEGGTASSPLYKDGTLVHHGIVLVTANYRLGVFGFLAHPELTRESAHKTSGNYGLMDQIAALRWVRDNIAKFGGDPANVTIFGQSAGAQDLSLLLTSPLAKGLFEKAIAESGSAMNPNLPTLAEAERAGEKLAGTWNVPAGEQTIQYLRKLTTGELLKAASGNRDGAEPIGIGPDLDGWVVPRLPAKVFADGKQMAIPLLIGSTSREFGSSASADELRKTIAEVMGDAAPAALAAYGLADGGQGTTDPLYGSVANQWLADLLFRCPAVAQAAWHTAAKHPTYEYQFEHAIPGQEADGAVHSSDLPYVFGYYPKRGNISGKFVDQDFQLADLIESYWTNFAKTGDPNGPGLPHWPEYDGGQAYIRFTQDGRVVAGTGGLRAAPCDLHRQALARRISQKQ
jgi:para-nitrobenzyl esterase